MNWWKNHGTKILGTIGTLAGLLATVDPAAITAFLNAIFGDRGPGIATMILGGLTIYKGFKNSKANAAPNP